MIGFDSLSDYVFPKFWLKTLARFFFQFILYLSVLVFHKGGVRGGGGGGGGGGGVEGATSWWVPHFFVRAELKLVSVVLVCTLIRYQIILALSKVFGFRFSVFIHSPTRMMLTDAEVLKFFLLDILFYPSRCGKEKTLNISLGIVVSKWKVN